MVSSRGGLFEIYLNEIGAFWKQFTSRHTVNILRKKILPKRQLKILSEDRGAGLQGLSSLIDKFRDAIPAPETTQLEDMWIEGYRFEMTFGEYRHFRAI